MYPFRHFIVIMKTTEVIKLENPLKQRRLEMGLTLEEVGKKVGVGKSTVRKWENGLIENMGRDKIVLLSKALNISPLEILGITDTDSSAKLTDVYDQLNEVRKNNVLTFAKKQLAEQNSIQETVIPFSPRTKQQGTEVTIYGAVSAGTGEMLGDGVTTKRCYFGRIPHHDYALTVNGDSMKPMFEDGQIIFVENVEDDMEFLDGQIVIAILNGESYIKKLRIMKNCAQLISLNAKYDPIEVSADDDFKIKGKVIL